jgi:hypothetical protein
MKLTPTLFLSLFAAIAMTSCVVPGDLAYSSPGYSSTTVGYRQYNTLPPGYVGSAYLYGGRYYSGGRYESGNFHDHGRTYNDRYYHNGQYYYGGSHQNYGNRPSSAHAGHDHDRSHRTTISAPTPHASVRSPFLFRR